MDLERERGITIKASAVTVDFEHKGRPYMLNLIDTPGHVDFHYEVSRAPGRLRGRPAGGRRLAGRRGPDGGQRLLATRSKLTLVPVINKIDLPSTRPDDAAMEMEHLLGAPAEVHLGLGQDGRGDRGAAGGDGRATARRRAATPTAPTKALIFDSTTMSTAA